MKSRKLVLLAGLLVAFLTGAEANDNQIDICGTVIPVAVVSFETASDLQRAGTYRVTLTVTIGVS
jgi:hypothetical protein